MKSKSLNQTINMIIENLDKMEINEIDENTFVGIDYFQHKCINYENQQKEFTEWLENGIETVKNTEFLDERIQRAGLIAYNRCLQKYKSIIGEGTNG